MFDPTQGPAREQVDSEEFKRLSRAGVAVADDRRRRPLYFDGRFLAARDLTRDQTYFLARQADLGRAGGAGIVNGLQVSAGKSASTLVLSPGLGVTAGGELVALPEPMTVNLSDLPEIQRLNTAFGLMKIPAEPVRSRSGLFIVALRPIEFSANPIAAYPTSLTGPRTVEDGEIIEGVAVTLIPYPDEGTRNEMDQRRSRAAREIFVVGGKRGLPAAALPLAMIALDRGEVHWIDPFLVRREVGAEHGDVLGLGFSPRALREAYQLQYERHLADVLSRRDAASRGRRFAASEHFLALPPAGRMPAAAIDPGEFTQIFFPPEVDVALSIVPEDEVAALLEESILLPPIDLTLSGESLESTSVLALIPVPRARMRYVTAGLSSAFRLLKSAAPALLARRHPLEVLRGLRTPPVAAAPVASESLADAAWRQALAGADLLWYVRRRNLQLKPDAAGVPVRVLSDEFADEKDLVKYLKTEKMYAAFHHLKTAGTAEADAEMVSLLSSPKMQASRTLMAGALVDLRAQKQLDRQAVFKVSERYAEPELGEGLRRLEEAEGDLALKENVVRNVTRSGVVPELDRLGRLAKDEEVAAVAREVVEAAREGAVPLAALVKAKLQEMEKKQ